MALRDYQELALKLVKEEWAKGNRKVLLWMPTGAGKTTVFCTALEGAISRGKKSLTVVRGRKLVDQASQRLWREKTEHGVLMANHWNHRPTLPAQVCSIDTLIARKLSPPADLIILDEVHLATSKGYREFLDNYPNAYILGCTATPYTPGGLAHVADAIVRPITMLKLIERGFLVGFRYFAPSAPDLTRVRVSASTGDYVNDDLEQSMSSGTITGSIIEHWLKIAKGRPTLCFAVNVHHSKSIVEEMNSAGIPAEHCDADTPEKEREKIIKRLETGKTKIVSNVGIFCTGVDIPPVSCIILARPTKSKNLFIQQAGRGTRTSPGKDNCILLDHAGNLSVHGFPTDEPEVDLDSGEFEEESVLQTKTCKNCFGSYRGKICPYCDTEAQIEANGDYEPKAIEVVDGELQEITSEDDFRNKAIKKAFGKSPYAGYGKRRPW